VRHRSDRIIRLIGAFKLVKVALLIAVGVGLLSMASDPTVAESVHAVRPGARFINEMLGKLLDVPPQHMRVIGVGSLVYAVVFAIEGYGLLRRRRWAEYMTTIITISFIPLEIYEMVEKGSWLKLGVIVANIAIVIYLIWRLREENKDIREEHDKQVSPDRRPSHAPSGAARA
jgi:uncharacterized membrane protein (DUF2068 family)